MHRNGRVASADDTETQQNFQDSSFPTWHTVCSYYPNVPFGDLIYKCLPLSLSSTIFSFKQEQSSKVEGSRNSLILKYVTTTFFYPFGFCSCFPLVG